MTRQRFRGGLLGASALLLCACAAVPNDSPVVEQLDRETGVTITRLGRPVELYRETLRQDSAGRFAFLAPFETNLMGKRETFLWIALPLENAAAPAAPTLAVNGTPLALDEPGRDAEFAGLRSSPYRIPMPWIAMFYYRIDAQTVTRLGEAHQLAVTVIEETRDGAQQTEYSGELGDDPRLRNFAAH